MGSRAGKTKTLSISVDEETFIELRRRAKKRHGGNMSAAVAEVTAGARERDGVVALMKKYGIPLPTEEEQEEIRREWGTMRRKTRAA